MSTQQFSTDALHAGHDVTTTQGTRAVPIYQSTSYVFNDTDHAANLFALAEPGYIYTRLNNPTADVLEQRMAALEGGIAAVATASGTSAISTALLVLLKAGDHIVASSSLYGGTFNMLKVMMPRLGITTTFVDPEDPKNFAAAVQDNTRLFFAESLGNPKLDVLDLKAISAEAQAAKVPFMVDNTVATPALLKPIEHGANIVIHSLTKYANGNGTAMGGVIVDAGTFDWSNGNFPEFTSPSAGYHGLVLHEALGPAAYIAKVRIEGLRDIGAAISPFNAFQIIQGLETWEVRMQKHSQNALELAQWLQDQDQVAWVSYPGLKGGFDAAKTVVNKTELFSLLANIGDTKSLVIHPASTTHQQLSEEEQATTGVTPDLVRLSVGLEDVTDLKADLKQAFDSL